MKDTWIGGTYNFDFGADIFSIQHHILAAPADYFLLIEATNLQEVRAVLARHSIAKVPPEPSVPGDHQLLLIAGQRLSLQCINHMRIVQAEDHRIVNLKQASFPFNPKLYCPFYLPSFQELHSIYNAPGIWL